MDSFLFATMLTFVIAFGGRDQMIVAHFVDAAGLSKELLWLGIACAIVSAVAMGWAGWNIAAILPSRAANMLVAMALAIAAFELFWPVRLKPMKEPTRSYVAIGTVLLFRQVGDAARFVIFAFAAQAVYPVVTIIGGALGGAAAILLGWWVGKAGLERFPLRIIRSVLAVCLIVAAFIIGLNARFV